jgi:sigma-B regulation protein RsbU (phosphoserine phosphatase)
VLSTNELRSSAWERSGILSRTPARILSARTFADLREALPAILLHLFGGHVRFELFFHDGRGELVPVLDGRDGSSTGGKALLASLSSRLRATRQDPVQPRAFPALKCAGDGSLMTAPLLDAGEKLAGLLVVERAPGEPDFTRMELVALEGVAALLALALQRLDVKQADVVRTRADLDRVAARRVQRGLMSSRLPPNAGVTAYSAYLPALDVGGDFYSLKYLGNGKVSVAIGDVSGNGVSAALVMSRVSSDIERALRTGGSPSTVLRDVNDGLSDLESERFVTASCIRLDTRSRKVTVANAGHLPLVVRRANGHAFTCGSASGMPLGMLPCEYEEEEIALEPRDFLLLVTDGLVEALDHPTGRNGMTVLLRLVQGAPHDPKVLHARIRAAVDRARAHAVLDDVTWVGLQLAA